MRQISPETGICFFRVHEPIALSEFLRGRDFSPLNISPDESAIAEWFDYGCIYVNGKRQRDDIDLQREQVVRLHTRRKRYAENVKEIRPRIVFDESEFLVLDKPAGLPTHPTLDNFRDNAKFRLESELGVPLFTTHRLDVPTAGLLLFAKTPEAQRVLNKSFSLGRVEKIYRCLNAKSAPLGLHTHFINPDERVPRPIQAAEVPGWWRVQMEILKRAEHPRGYWHEIKLLTGKTHQIRTQMAFLGAPILGDSIYGGESGGDKTSLERIALECLRLSFTFRSRTFAIDRPRSLIDPQYGE